MRFPAVAALALGAFAFPAAADVAQSPSERLATLPEPLQVFAMNCVASMTASEEQVRKRLDSDPAVMAYGSELTATFLGEKPGKAWGFRGRDSTYVVALADDRTCMVFASEAKREGIIPALETLLDVLFPGIGRVALSPPLPENAQTRSKVYAIQLQGHPLAGATVSSDPQYNFAARLVLVPPRPPEG